MMVRSFIETPVPNDIAYSPTTVAIPIAEGLSRKGHEVTFFGPEGTHMRHEVKVETCGIRPLARTANELEDVISVTDMFSDYKLSLYDLRMAREMLERANAGEYDCVIFNHFESVLPLAKLFPSVPIVYILHDYMDEDRRRLIETFDSPNQYFISISNSQRRHAPDLNYYETVYNGINANDYTYEPEPEDYLMFAGRIIPDKGVKEAVQVAQAVGKRLLIAGSLTKSNYWYFDEHIKPHLNDKILFLGMLDREQLIKYYKKASSLLVPIQWEEPFGLTMTEAMACGTPAIAFRRGAVPEVIDDGKTGFIVDNSAEMIMAVEKIGSIKRQDCRNHVAKNFTHEIMADNYERVLSEIIDHCCGKEVTKKRRKATFTDEITRLSKKWLG